MTETQWKQIHMALRNYTGLRSKFTARLAAARSRLAILRKECLQKVTRWEWYSSAFYDLDPLHFHGNSFIAVKPGKRLAREPLSKLETIRYGFDETGRLLVADEFGVSIEFFVYRKDWVEATTFASTSCPVRIQSLFFNGNQPLAHIDMTASAYGKPEVRVQLFQHRGKRLAAVASAYDPSSAGKWWYTYTIIKTTKTRETVLDTVTDDVLGLSRNQFAYPIREEPIPLLSQPKLAGTKEVLKLKHTPGEPDSNMVAKITKARLKKLSGEKLTKLDANERKSTMKLLIDCARAMGVEVTQ
jgi:hypothetical protein